MSFKNDRTFSPATGTATWERLSALILAIAPGISISDWRDVVARVPTGGVSVRFAATDSGTAPSADTLGVLIAASEYRSFAKLNLDAVWVKSATASTIEITGSPQ